MKLKFFYDTEFLDNGKTIELVSIGIVRPEQKVIAALPENDFIEDVVTIPLREYYAVNRDMPWRRVVKHGWLSKNVVPYLPTTGRGGQMLDKKHSSVKPKEQIAYEVEKFLTWTHSADSSYNNSCSPILHAWYGAYDHVVLMQLWGSMMERPHAIPMWTFDLKQEAFRQGNSSLPKRELKEHDALEDARHNVEIARALGVLQ